MPRKVILGLGTSIDGYIARRNGALDFLVMDKDGESVMADFFAGFEVVSGALTAFVGKLKRRQGKDIYLGGGGELARSFLQEDLVDELFIGVSPMLLGDGIPGFPGKFPQREFKLTECKPYSNGSGGLRYERMRTRMNVNRKIRL